MPTSSSYAEELSLALRVVHTASLLTKSVLRSVSNNVTAETKADSSPVTVADFAAQALIISALHAVYPGDAFLGEESAEQLRRDAALAERVWQLVLQAAQANSSQSGAVQHVPKNGDAGTAAVPLAFPASKSEMLDAIDRGGSGSLTSEGRVWVMDPVDGTATFMTGHQYAVALCLLVDGKQQVGVIGCPNLALDLSALGSETGPHRIREELVDEAGFGVVLSAVKGHGTHVRTMAADALGDPLRIQHPRPPKQLCDLDFVETTIGKTSLAQTDHHAVASLLGAPWPGTVLWSQQMKYVALALGSTDVMLRLPTGPERYTAVWDHAGGQLLFAEVGGILRDVDGQEIDFAQGRLLRGERNYGLVATLPWAFDDVLRAVREVLGKRGR